MQNVFTRERIIGLIGILTAFGLYLLVQAMVPVGAVSTLRIPYAKGGPQDAPLIDIPLPTAASILALAVVLVVVAIIMIWQKRATLAPAYMAGVIGVAIFSILLTAIANNRTDIVDMLGRAQHQRGHVALVVRAVGHAGAHGASGNAHCPGCTGRNPV